MTEEKFADEMLEDGELDQVAGGDIDETLDDNDFLYNHGLMEKKYQPGPFMLDWRVRSSEIDAGWAKAGITCVTKPFGSNLYFINGQEISRNEAYDIVKSKFQKIR